MSADMPETVTTTEAARMLHLSLSGVQTAIERWRMQAVKQDGRWFVSVAEVERYRLFHLHSQESSAAVDRSHRRRHGGGRSRKGIPPSSA